MEGIDLSEIRVLLVGLNTNALQLLRSVLATAGVITIVRVEDSQSALELLSDEQVNAVFCDSKVDRANEKSFIVEVRRCKSVLNPMVPIFVLQERARRRDVEKARDNGVTDVVTTPISPKTLIAKLKAATLTPRPFIVASEFFGPDRRAKVRPTFCGSDRRTTLAKKVKVDFSLV
jgi:two-component system chemotaxis response regulator CheY